MKAFDLLKKKKKTKKTSKIPKKIETPKKKRYLILAIASTLVFLLFIFLTIEPSLYKERPLPRIYIAGIKLNSANKNELISKLDKKAAEFKKQEIEVFYEEKKWNLDTSAIDFNLEISSANAVAYGKNGSFGKQLWERFKLLFYKQTIPLVAKYDEKKWLEFVDSIKKDVEYPYQNAGLKFEGLNLLDIDAKLGLIIDENKLTEELKNQFAHLNIENLELKTKKTTPKILQSQTQIARKKALSYISANVEVIYKSNKYIFKPEEIKDWIVFNEKMDTFNKPFLTAELDKDTVKNKISEKTSSLESEPQNVKIAFESNNLVVIEPSKTGFGVNYKQLIADLDRILQKTTDRKINLKLSAIKPEISENNLDSLGIKELIAEGRSSFSGSSSQRIVNIKVGASKVHGYLIKPEEVFSLNSILGPIDGEHGFVPELVIKENKTIPEFGGGLCQVATTVFRAALLSGLPITERKNHAYRVHYYEWPYGPGVDATIYPPHPDVQFKNDTKNYILVQTRIYGKTLTFEFYGTKNKEGIIHKPITLWSKPDGSLATVFNRDILVEGKVVHTDSFKSVYKSPSLYPRSN